MNRRALTALVGIAAMLIAVACNSTNTSSTGTGGKPLIAEPTTGVTFSEDFNPFDNNSVTSSMGTRTIVNEPLVEFDQLDATAAGTHMWLATAYAFQNSGKDLQVTIRTGVKFSDGSSFGPADVAHFDFTFIIANHERRGHGSHRYRVWITIVDAQCQAKKPNCFLALELRIDSIAPNDVLHVTDACQSSDKAEPRFQL